MDFKKTGDRQRYRFLDAKCIGRDCWSPGLYQVRGATLGGSRNTGDARACCIRRAYHGCPEGPDGHKLVMIDGVETTLVGKPSFNPVSASKRKLEGWRKA